MSGPLFLDTVDGASGVDTGDIPASLRFRSGNYMVRTPGGSDSRRLITLSMWVKRCALGVFQRTFGADDIGSATFAVGFNTNNKLEIRDFAGSYLIQGISTQVFRDTTSWIHLVVAFDTNQTTFANAVKAYVNGVQITAWDTSTYSGAHDMQINDTRKQSFGVYLASGVPTAPYDYGLDYLARPCLVTGSQLTPSSFGYKNTEINEWVTKSQSAVKAVVDAGGTNSFMLDFDNGTSLTTLGYDKSSKGNNWTLNNFSLTAGTSYDRMLDVPGNSFATLNPIYPSAANITNGNLTSGTTAVRATQNALAYDCKWEVTASGSAVTAGVISATGTTNTTTVTANKCFAFRMTTAGSLDYKNVTDGGSWTSITTGLSGEQYPYGTTAAANWNFGQAPLHASATYQSAADGYFYDTTSGYKALCQRNMPDPAILNPEKHFDVLLHSGNTSTQNVTGAQFQPDLAWIKSRNTNYWNFLYDSVRGATKALVSNSTNAEATYAAGLTGFLSNGISLGNQLDVNGSTYTYVDWLWKAGGAAVTNNAGSISSQVSANVEAGFSIVTYTGNLSSVGTATVGHGLGQAPGLIISKSRNNSGGDNGQWVVRHKSLASANHYLRLNTTDTPVDSSANGSMSASTSTVFSTNWTSGMNINGGNFVAYCFAEIPGFSKIFSYTGNGAADGPVVQCGFKPKFILLKNASAAGNGWIIYDAVRNTYNVMDLYLQPNTSSAEGAVAYIDTVSNGFKVRTANADANGSTNTIIGIAFADVSGKFALAR